MNEEGAWRAIPDEGEHGRIIMGAGHETIVVCTYYSWAMRDRILRDHGLAQLKADDWQHLYQRIDAAEANAARWEKMATGQWQDLREIVILLTQPFSIDSAAVRELLMITRRHEVAYDALKRQNEEAPSPKA